MNASYYRTLQHRCEPLDLPTTITGTSGEVVVKERCTCERAVQRCHDVAVSTKQKGAVQYALHAALCLGVLRHRS